MDDQAKVTHPASLPQAILANVNFALSKLNTCLPAVIEKYDPGPRRAHVKPQIKKKLSGGETQTLPVIPGVPVHFMLSSSQGGLRFDLKPGDSGLLLFCQRSLDEWLAQGGDVDPKDVRRFAITDAIFIPGLVPFSARPSSEPAVVNSLILDYAGVSLRMNGGKVALGNTGAELLDVINQMLTRTIAAVVPTAVGTYPLDPGTIANLTTIQALLGLIKGTL